MHKLVIGYYVVWWSIEKSAWRTRSNTDKLAQYLHVNRATIAGYEVKGKEPRYETLIKLADYFDVSIDYLFTEEENQLGIQK